MIATFEDIGFYIPSRAREEKQITYSNLPVTIRRKVTFVLYEEEVENYRKALGKINVMVCKKKGIGPKRQWVLDNAPEPFIFMFDDDCSFYTRHENMKLKRSTKKEVQDMFVLLSNWLRNKEAYHVGMSFRSLNFTTQDDYKEIGHVYSCWGLNRLIAKEANIRADRTEFIEDVMITLGYITNGYKNRITYKYAVSQNTNTEGGCKITRNGKTNGESAKVVHEVYPYCTKIYTRKNKNREGWPDIRVSWVKAWEHGQAVRRGKGISSFIKG